MIIEDTANQLWQVRETSDPSIRHYYIGHKVKRGRNRRGLACFLPRRNAQDMLVRKAHTKIIQSF